MEYTVHVLNEWRIYICDQWLTIFQRDLQLLRCAQVLYYLELLHCAEVLYFLLLCIDNFFFFFLILSYIAFVFSLTKSTFSFHKKVIVP